MHSGSEGAVREIRRTGNRSKTFLGVRKEEIGC
jgi:hypothetical protein